jgi:hypothetical protein
MTLAVPVPGLVRVVLPAHAGAALVERARRLELPDAQVEVRRSGSDAARGRVDLVLFVQDPDAFDEAAIRESLALLRRDLSTAAVGPSIGEAAPGALELAVSGRLLLVRADALRGVGGWDGARGGALDDLDLCCRLWLAGHRVRTTGRVAPLLGHDAPAAEREAAVLRTLATVLDDEDVADDAWSEAPAAAALAGARGRRAAAQRSRRRGSGELVPLLHRWCERWPGEAPEVGIVRRWGAPARAGARRRILVVTTDVVAPVMAGPGIRACEVAGALAAEHEVVLASTARCELSPSGYEARFASEKELRHLVEWCDVVVFQGWVMAGRSWLRDTDKVVVADLYDPMHLEQLEQGHEAAGERGRYDAVRGAAATLNEQMRRADLLLCASAKQRDLWLGSLGALGRINAITYDEDPSLGQLLALAPFGVPDAPMPAGPGALKGVVPGIGVDDKVILWGGGVYNWFDPLTLVRAVDRVRATVPGVRLFFLGLAHPNPEVPEMRMVRDLRALVDELGLGGTHVLYNDGWVAYEDRAGFLRDADVGVSTHLHHLETEFSFRTRILDYLWAGLPVVATGGDSFAELLEGAGAGRTVAPGDVDALAAALEEVLVDPEAAAAARAGSVALGRQLSWSRSLVPLVEFCRAPRRSPDVACPTVLVSPDGAELTRGFVRDVKTGWAYLRAGGVGLLVDRATTRVRRQLARG